MRYMQNRCVEALYLSAGYTGWNFWLWLHKYKHPQKIRRGMIMIKLNNIAPAPMAVFCDVVSAAEQHMNINGFAATIATGKWWVML